MLTDREKQVLIMLADTDFITSHAADRLHLEITTIKFHLRAIRTKLKKPTTAAAHWEAVKRGYLAYPIG